MNQSSERVSWEVFTKSLDMLAFVVRCIREYGKDPGITFGGLSTHGVCVESIQVGMVY